MLRCCAWLILIGVLAFSSQAAPQAGASFARAETQAGYTGVASCAGSTCHGRAEGNGEVVRQDEIATWQEPSLQSGAHSRAFAALLGQRGKQIAARLGLGNPATAGECLGCHTTNAPAASRGARFLASDGVGCESCHGPALAWIASHYAKPASHALNLAKGLARLEDPQTRAGICLDCHYGSDRPGQFVTHAMMAAGHPRLSFELELFSALQQHHDVDADYLERKPAPDSVRLWAVGQAEAVSRTTALFADSRLRMNGIFPQFYFFDCHSCHRSIADGPGQQLTFETNPGRPIPFANPPFNDENIIMLGVVARILAPGAAGQFESASRQFHQAMAGSDGALPPAIERLHAQANGLSAALAQASPGRDAAFEVVAALAEATTGRRFTDYAGSAQAVMAVEAMLNALVRQGRVTVGAAAGIRADINRAYEAVRSPQEFNPARFRTALGSATSSIGKLR
jgi:hypothetical protein